MAVKMKIDKTCDLNVSAADRFRTVDCDCKLLSSPIIVGSE